MPFFSPLNCSVLFERSPCVLRLLRSFAALQRMKNVTGKIEPKTEHVDYLLWFSIGLSFQAGSNIGSLFPLSR